MASRRTLPAAVAVVCLGVTGCAYPLAGWMDPLVGTYNPAAPPATLSDAIADANKTKAELFAAMSNQARLATLTLRYR